MKKEYICYYFDKCFKGKVDEQLFNTAKNYLFYILVANDLDVNNFALREFTKVFYEIQYRIEKEVESKEAIVEKIQNFNSLNLMQKISYKRKYGEALKLYQNCGKFNNAFIDVFGISLVKVKDLLDNEKCQNQQLITQDLNKN